MKIAVTYDKKTASIGQHFGKTEAFVIYEVEDNKVVSSKIVDAEGSGHGALPPFLKKIGAEVVICGGLGAPMVGAIEALGIKLIRGISGNADEAVVKYLAGELDNVEAGELCGCHGYGHDHEEGNSCNCHGEEEEHSCNCHSEEGHSCGCHSTMEGENVGKTLRVHYKGTFNDGTQFDSSYDRGEPLEFICGAGMMIKGFDMAVKDMKVGEVKDIHLMPEEAYGMPDPRAIFTVEIAEMPGAEDAVVGSHVYLSNQMGQPFPVLVADKTETTITFDANHEMAGKELNFKIEIVEII